MMFFKQVTEVEQGRGIRHPFTAQIDPAKLTKNRNIVQRILTGDVAQVEPWAIQYIRSIRSRPTGGRPLPTFG